MSRLEIHVETLVLDGMRADEADPFLRGAEQALGELLAGRPPATGPDEPAGALAAALADAVRDALGTPA